MASIFAVATPKGGNGKTTVSVLLAGVLAKQSYAIALIDAYPQGSDRQSHATSLAHNHRPGGIKVLHALTDGAALKKVAAGRQVQPLRVVDQAIRDYLFRSARLPEIPDV